MRIISGVYKKRRLFLPNEKITRPTTDRIKETLFNKLTHAYDIDFNDLNVLDAYAGSGSLGLDCLSRGAHTCYFFEKNRSVFSILLKNADGIGGVKAQNKDFLKAKSPESVDLIFLDPPYFKGLESQTFTALSTQGWLKKDTLIILESDTDVEIDIPEQFHCMEKITLGHTKISFIKPLTLIDDHQV